MKRTAPVTAIMALCAGTFVSAALVPPTNAGSFDETALLLPTAAKLAIWTDKLGYLRWRELISVYLTVDPMDDLRRYTTFVYLENIETGRRQYLVHGNYWSLRDEAVDWSGTRPRRLGGERLFELAPTRIWSGRALGAGLWQFVAELRSPDTTEIVKRAHAKFVVSEWLPAVMGAGGLDIEISTDTTWTNDRVHAIQRQVFVNAGATLTIEPGTLILARGPHAAIIVEKGGRIIAEGRPDAPIVMTCDETVGNRFPGCWGGLAILGNAPVAGGTVLARGVVPQIRAEYGGDDPLDSSGVLSYVRVEFAGASSESGTRTGGISFLGVGSRTRIDHIQSHASDGGGIEFVGGTANCMYCVSSGALEDGLNWIHGWRGTAQFVFVRQGPSGNGNGLEGGSDEDGVELFRSSSPTIYNLTVIGQHGSQGNGIVLRGNSGLLARNAVVMGFGGSAIDIRDTTPSLSLNGTRSIQNTILHANGGALGTGPVNGSSKPSVEFVESEPNLVNIRYEASPDPRPKLDSPAIKVGAAVLPPSNGLLDTSARYIGAFLDSNWLEEWTFFGSESDYRMEASDGTR